MDNYLYQIAMGVTRSVSQGSKIVKILPVNQNFPRSYLPAEQFHFPNSLTFNTWLQKEIANLTDLSCIWPKEILRKVNEIILNKTILFVIINIRVGK